MVQTARTIFDFFLGRQIDLNRIKKKHLTHLIIITGTSEIIFLIYKIYLFYPVFMSVSNITYFSFDGNTGAALKWILSFGEIINFLFCASSNMEKLLLFTVISSITVICNK